MDEQRHEREENVVEWALGEVMIVVCVISPLPPAGGLLKREFWAEFGSFVGPIGWGIRKTSKSGPKSINRFQADFEFLPIQLPGYALLYRAPGTRRKQAGSCARNPRAWPLRSGF